MALLGGVLRMDDADLIGAPTMERQFSLTCRARNGGMSHWLRPRLWHPAQGF